ncbi:hypothetical protein, partial [Sphingobium cloacae]|uniref:hypothetical protein n=1 Tax=Sphingobium cloacae TaxID=120107 RepID=UPI001C3F2CB7
MIPQKPGSSLSHELCSPDDLIAEPAIIGDTKEPENEIAIHCTPLEHPLASSFVGQQVAHAPSGFERRRHRLHIADVASRQHQHIGTADDVGERVDL